MDEYSPWLRENEDLVNRALASYDAARTAPTSQPAVTDEQLLDAPSPAPAAPAPTHSPAVAPVEMPTARPRQALSEVQGQQVDSANQQIESVLREGQVEQGSAAEQAGIIGAGAEEAKEILGEARERVGAKREKINEYDKQRDEVIAKLSEPLPTLSAGRRAGTVIAGIVGVMGSMAGVNGLAYGMQAVQEMIGSKLKEQLQDRDRNKELLGVLNDTLKSMGVENASELDQARILASNELLVTEQEVRKVAKDLEGTKAGEDAIQLAEQLREKALGNIAAIQQQKIQDAEAAAQKRAAQRAQQAATAEEAQLYAGLSRAKTDEERQDIAAMYGARGAKALKEFYDNRKAGVESSAAEDTDAAPLGREVEDPALWRSVTEGEKSDFRGAQASFQSFEADAEKLKDLLRKHGNESYSKHAAKMESIIGSMIGKYNKMMKFGALDAGTQEIMKSILGNPNALWGMGSRSVERLDTALQSSRSGIESQARNLGLRSNAPQDVLARSEGAPEDRMRPTPSQSPAPTASPARVSMRNPQTGHEVLVKPELVEAFQSKGYQQAQSVASEKAHSFFGTRDGQLPRWSQGR